MKKLLTILLLLSPLLAFSQLEGKWKYDTNCEDSKFSTGELVITTQNRDDSFEGKIVGESGKELGTFIGTLKCNTLRIILINTGGGRQVWTGFLNTRTETMSGTYTDSDNNECSWTAKKASF